MKLNKDYKKDFYIFFQTMIIEEKFSRTFNILHWIEDVMESYGTTNKTIAELLLEVL